jgi:hypothetical protein
MNCANHGEVAASAFCRACGKALCLNCSRSVQGVVYCEDCVAAKLGTVHPPVSAPPPANSAPRPARVPGAPSPGLAIALGFIPGVGAMYNGQFMKGIIHVLAFVCLIWMTTRAGLLGIFIPFLIFYMVFDAYKTAHALELGEPVPDPFGLEQFFGETRRVVPPVSYTTADPAGGVNPPPLQEDLGPPRHSLPMGAIVLIILGSLFLLQNIGLFEFHWIHRLWPLMLIGIGAWLLAKRVRS